MPAKPARKKRRTATRFVRWGKRLLRLHAMLAFLFLYLPIMILVAFSFNDSKLGARWAGFTFDWYTALLTSESILSSTWNTLLVGVVGFGLGATIATHVAVARLDGRGGARWSRLVVGVSAVVAFLPATLVAIGVEAPVHGRHHALHLATFGGVNVDRAVLLGRSCGNGHAVPSRLQAKPGYAVNADQVFQGCGRRRVETRGRRHFQRFVVRSIKGECYKKIT